MQERDIKKLNITINLNTFNLFMHNIMLCQNSILIILISIFPFRGPSLAVGEKGEIWS